MASLFDNVIIDKCIEEYKKGNCVTNVGKKYCVDKVILKEIMLHKGIVIKGYTSSANYGSLSISDYTDMYISGISMAELSRRYGIHREFLSYLLHEKGVPIRNDARRYIDNPTAFASIDDEISAYTLGFFYADAGVQNAKGWCGVDIGLAYRDYDHLCKIRDWISPGRDIKVSSAICNGKSYPTCRLKVGSKIIADRLVLLGCVPNKTFILTFPTEEQVRLSLLHHFMRGYFDGDGSIGCKNPIFSVKSTREFLVGYFNVLSDYGITMTKISKPSGCYCVAKSGKKQLKIIHKFLYNDSHIHLERKKIVFDQIVNNGRQ
jgi:hypothetical protein